jgi:hypothetical protein
MEPKVIALSIGEMIAVATFALSILGALFHIVWLLSKMKTQMEHFTEYRLTTDRRLDDHAECIDSHGRDIAQIKGRLRLAD